MKFKEKKNVLIFCVCGKAGSGKSLLANYLYEEYKKNGHDVIISPYTKYLKKYISEVLGKEINDNFKPRTFLQEFSSDLIKDKLGYKDFFIVRQLEDISIYKYFFDVIIIPDVRFPDEIECLKKRNYNVVSIGMIRSGFDNNLSYAEKNDITEIALDDYKDYDFIVNNNEDVDLKNEVCKIIRKVDKNG